MNFIPTIYCTTMTFNPSFLHKSRCSIISGNILMYLEELSVIFGNVLMHLAESLVIFENFFMYLSCGIISYLSYTVNYQCIKCVFQPLYRPLKHTARRFTGLYLPKHKYALCIQLSFHRRS